MPFLFLFDQYLHSSHSILPNYLQLILLSKGFFKWPIWSVSLLSILLHCFSCFKNGWNICITTTDVAMFWLGLETGHFWLKGTHFCLLTGEISEVLSHTICQWISVLFAFVRKLWATSFLKPEQVRVSREQELTFHGFIVGLWNCMWIVGTLEKIGWV